MEIRFIDPSKTTFTRAVDDTAGDVVGGYAIVFNSLSEDLGGFQEIIAPGALNRSLQAAASGQQRIYAFWSHDSSQVIGSTGAATSGKLEVSQDDLGLSYTLTPDRLSPMMSGALREGDMRMSFGMIPQQETWDWDRDIPLRTITDLDLFEISPVAFPAYPATSAGFRSLSPESRAKAAQAGVTAGKLTPAEARSMFDLPNDDTPTVGLAGLAAAVAAAGLGVVAEGTRAIQQDQEQQEVDRFKLETTKRLLARRISKASN